MMLTEYPLGRSKEMDEGMTCWSLLIENGNDVNFASIAEIAYT